MKLYEFFGSLDNKDHRDKNEDGKVTQEEKDQFKNDLFFYILDNDNLHKEQFFKIKEEISHNKECENNVWMPLVTKGCLEYYKENRLQDDPKDLFDSEFREELCTMLDDHYRKDIIEGEYK